MPEDPVTKCPVQLFIGDQAKGPLDTEQLAEETKTLSSFRLNVRPSGNGTNGDGFDILFSESKNLLGKELKELPSSSNATTTCHYEAVDENKLHSAISTCSPSLITGVFRVSSQQAFVLSNDQDGFHLIPQNSNRCDFPRRSKRAGHLAPNTPHYYQNYIDDVKRYVELIFIADYSVYEKLKKDETAVHDHMQSIANVVNSLYAPLNIRVILVWADIWKDGNVFEITENSDMVLNEFLKYRKEKLLIHPHDNAQLLTEVRFANRVIGKAFRGTMCSYDFSGGVIVNDERIAFTGSTVTHEMGHNFGMEHDLGYPDPCKCAANMCIMSPSSGSLAPTTFWSDCSLDFLSHALKRGADYCLLNVPKAGFGGAKCGNGIVEDGEDCDCGSKTECPNKCCIASECRLAQDAECADGDCCDTTTCKPRQMATVCRKAMNSCDLPEFCDGENPKCPADFFVGNGLPCPDAPEDFCYNGYCGSRDQNCQFIWGKSGQSAASECYLFNQYGSAAGNCGLDPDTKTYKRCAKEDATCGRLQCTHMNERPEFGDPSSVFPSYQQVKLSDGRDVACRSIRTTYVGGKQADPGMVSDGAKCGPDKMCIKSKCTNRTAITEMTSKCDPTNCRDKGICNNVGNCHCKIGYGGQTCDIPGYGGSVNSGPASDQAFNPGMVLLYLSIIGLIIFIIATVYCKRRWNIWLHKEMMTSTRKALKIRSVLVPVRPAPPPPGQARHRHSHNPLEALNSMWNRFSNSHHHQAQHNPPHQQAPQQTNQEVLTVRAVMPILPHYYAADNPQTSPTYLNNTFHNDYQPSQLSPNSNFEHVPSTTTHIRSDSYKRAHQIPPIVPEHRRLNADSHSSSSDEASNPPKITRPSNAPPPPPARPNKHDNNISKPKLPPKPPLHKKPNKAADEDASETKISVKDMAAKFNGKLSNV